MGVRVGIGFGRFPFEGIATFKRWLEHCEEGTIDSIWQSDRVVSKDPYLEPMSLLAMVAGATETLKFGMNAVVLGFRDPVNFARQCASIDRLSEGRLLPVVAIGQGQAPEWKATGRSPKGRGARADEALEVITRLWREESVSFEGKYFQLHEATICPRPRQNPLPLWIGGSSPAAIRRTIRFGTGWLAPLADSDEIARSVLALKAEGERVGRPLPGDHYGATILYRLEANSSGSHAQSETASANSVRARLEKILVRGDADTILARFRSLYEAGIEKFIAIPWVQQEADFIEQTRLLEAEVIPEAMKLG